jgi:rhodanese-related sulfurtransferase
MKMPFAAALAAAITTLAAPAVLACGGHQSASAETTVVAANTDKAAPAQKSTPEATFKIVTVDQVQQGLDALKKDKKPYAVFDANGKSTRDKMGVIPTSVLLPSASEYDLALLPADKATPVVFYCANEKCTASHTAAKRAMAAGWGDVAVLAVGIKGWVDAGKAVDKPVG